MEINPIVLNKLKGFCCNICTLTKDLLSIPFHETLQTDLLTLFFNCSTYEKKESPPS